LPNLGQLVSHNGAWGRAPRESGVPSWFCRRRGANAEDVITIQVYL
jgi:hypothetical protein